MLTEIKKKEEEGTSNENCLFCLLPFLSPFFILLPRDGEEELEKKQKRVQKGKDVPILSYWAQRGKKGTLKFQSDFFVLVSLTVSGTSQIHGFSFSEKSFGGI